MIILYANKYDTIHKYNDSYFWDNQKEFENFLLDKSYEKAFKEQYELDETSFRKKYIEKIIKETRLKQSIKSFYIEHFTEEILTKYEEALVKSFNYSNEEFTRGIETYIKVNPEIKGDVEFLNNYKMAVNNNELPKIEFGEAFEKNYLKILQNIYFLNLKKTHQAFREKNNASRGESKTEKELLMELDIIYEQSIRQTRSTVLKFFQVKKSELEYKTLMTLYFYYLNPYHPTRIKVEFLNNYFSVILNGIAQGYVFPKLLDVSNIDPVDEYIDFSEIVENRMIDREKNISC